MGAHDLRRASGAPARTRERVRLVQVARNLPGIVAVRDSKDPSALPSSLPPTSGAHSSPTVVWSILA